MQDVLYINGEAVDLGGKAVNLEYINNVLSDIDKISSSHSYTIKLPLTSRNSRIFDMVENVAHVSSRVGVYLPAEYRRNGVTITKDAQAYVTEASPEGISICLVWDSFAALSTWLKAGKKLRDLTFPAYTWGTAPTPWSASLPPVVVAKYQTLGTEVIMPAPTVSATYILNEIMSEAGIAVSYDAASTGFGALYVPLCSRIGTKVPDAGGVFDAWHVYAPTSPLGDVTRRVRPVTRYSGSMAVESQGIIQVADVDAGALDVYVSMVFDFGSIGVFDFSEFLVLEFVAHNTDGTDNVLQRLYSDSAEGTSFRRLSGTFTLSDLEGVSYIYMRVSGFRAQVASTFTGVGTLTVVPTKRTAVQGEPYPVGGNMPEMSQVDYVKALCVLCGVQVVQQGETLRFVSISDYAQAVASGVADDWSAKIVNYQGVPTSVQYKVGDYAQRNWLRYSEDEENGGVAVDGLLLVSDRTLEYEKDLAKIPFAASRDSIINHYQRNNEGNIEDVEVEPRIGTVDEYEGEVRLRFRRNEMAFDTRIANYYGSLARLLTNAHQVRVYARLSEYDLAGLDWLRPVYLAQTGQYYIVSKVSTDTDSDICEVTLIQLNN